MSKMVTLEFFRIRRTADTASVTFEVTDEAAAALQESNDHLDAWALYTVAPNMIKEWTETPGDLAPKITFKASWAEAETEAKESS